MSAGSQAREQLEVRSISAKTIFAEETIVRVHQNRTRIRTRTVLVIRVGARHMPISDIMLNTFKYTSEYRR